MLADKIKNILQDKNLNDSVNILFVEYGKDNFTNIFYNIYQNIKSDLVLKSVDEFDYKNFNNLTLKICDINNLQLLKRIFFNSRFDFIIDSREDVILEKKIILYNFINDIITSGGMYIINYIDLIEFDQKFNNYKNKNIIKIQYEDESSMGSIILK